MKRIEALVTLRNDRKAGGVLREGEQRRVSDRYADELVKLGYARIVSAPSPAVQDRVQEQEEVRDTPDEAPVTEDTADAEVSDRFVVEQSGQWTKIMDSETGERAVWPDGDTVDAIRGSSEEAHAKALEMVGSLTQAYSTNS